MVKKKETVVVGLSGGVDSSVAAYLLKEQGYNVIGVFMKNWDETDPNGVCTAERDFSDVKRVAERLDIPYYSINFEREYMDSVFKVFLDGLKNGITPNPDILCNREIKFGPFIEFAKKLGADFVATGHYAKLETHNGDIGLYKSFDKNKDQSYFLCGLRKEQLEKIIFPLADIDKPTVREIAKKLKLVTHDKKDSTGICFIGERNFRGFLKTYLGNQPGDIKTLDGRVIGKHIGLMYYTVGQRKGLGLGATNDSAERWFVIKKDMATNTLFVNNGECPELYSKSLVVKEFNWITRPEEICINRPANDFNCMAKTRYRQPDQECNVKILDSGVMVTFAKPQRAVCAGQWVALYYGDCCLGGGEIAEVM